MSVKIIGYVKHGTAMTLRGREIGHIDRAGKGGGYPCKRKRTGETRLPAQAAGLVSHRDVASEFGVSPHTVRLWVRSGLWPLPRLVCGASLYFNVSDVECWLRTGI